MAWHECGHGGALCIAAEAAGRHSHGQQPRQGILHPRGGKPPCIRWEIYLPSDAPLSWIARGLFGLFCLLRRQQEGAAIPSSYGATGASATALQLPPARPAGLQALEPHWGNLCCAPASSPANEVEGS